MDLRVVNLEAAEHIRIVKKNLTKPVGMHLHSYYELEMVLSGSGQQNLNGTVYPLGPDSVYFLTPIDFHAVTPQGEMEIVNISFDETLLSPQLRLLFMNRRDNFIFTDRSGALRHTVALLQQEQDRHDEYSEICRRDLLEVLLYTVAREKGREHTGSMQVHKSMQYLFRHFREDISLETVAAQSGYTPNYFSHLFHEITGEKFVDFLGNLRLNYCKMLLLSTDLSVSEVAEKSGFGSASAMYRRLYKITGLSPTAYRTKMIFCRDRRPRRS